MKKLKELYKALGELLGSTEKVVVKGVIRDNWYPNYQQPYIYYQSPLTNPNIVYCTSTGTASLSFKNESIK